MGNETCLPLNYRQHEASNCNSNWTQVRSVMTVLTVKFVSIFPSVPRHLHLLRFGCQQVIHSKVKLGIMNQESELRVISSTYKTIILYS